MRRGRPTPKLAIMVILIVALIAIGLLLARGRGPGTGGHVTLQGGGSSFLYPQIQAWIDQYSRENPNVTINYSPTGSGTGQSQFLQGVLDFAGSDPPLKRGVWEKYRGDVLQVPVIVGAVVVVYNVPGVGPGLNLSGEVLAKIYKGEIEYWDDPAITSLNPHTSLPHEKIMAVHRSDSSGTTNVFTLFLHKAAPDTWPEDLVGKTIDWPVDSTGRGVGGKGNQGVAEQVRQTPYSIGYVELAYATQTGLPVARIENSAGRFIEPSNETIMAAAEGAISGMSIGPRDDWNPVFEAIVYAPGEDSYPIATLSFLILRASYNDQAKAEALAGFLEWLAHEGYKHVVKGYVPLPESARHVLTDAANILRGAQP